MLTGESVPVVKNALLPIKDVYDPKNSDSCRKHTLYSGTKVIMAKKRRQNFKVDGQQDENSNHVAALVIRTGFVTTKGALVRDILYPKDTKFKFY